MAPILLASSAIAAPSGINADETSAEVSSQEVVCDVAGECEQSIGVTARVTGEAPSLSGDLPERDCVNHKDIKETVAGCQVRNVTFDEGGISTYTGVQGLDLGEEGTRGADTQTQQSARTGNQDSAWWTVETDAAVLLGALGATASGAAAWFGVRRVLTFLLAPLASRLKQSELLDNKTRRRIYETVEKEPGINLRGLANRLDIAWGTLLHHLKKLEEGHLLSSERYGKYRRFFLNGSTYSEEEQARLAALATPSTARVAEYILENPGTNQTEIGDAIGVTPSTVLFHVRRLQDVELVSEERDGRYVHYYPQLQEHEAEHLAAV